MKRVLGLILTCMLLAGCQTVTQRPLREIEPVKTPKVKALADGQIDWTVENRFRLIPAKVDPTTTSVNGEAPVDEETRFYRDVGALIGDQRRWYAQEAKPSIFAHPAKFDLIHPLPNSTPSFRNYETHYSTRTGSYRCSKETVTPDYDPLCNGDVEAGKDWLTDPSRIVDLSVQGYDGRTCVWTVNGSDMPGPCTKFRLSVIAGQANQVGARLAEDPGASPFAPVEVNVRDVKIVALGDSFSAGEGIPHSQWRGFLIGRRPALWLDPRCHRSLLSGPSLTAAYIALRDPKLSVTLLHYGCSGASVADGVVGPWGYLETHKTITSRNNHFTEKLKSWQGQDTVPMNGEGKPDVGRSQIGQALSDLTWDDVYHRPDVVIVSVGGNDIGFGSIVQGLLMPGLPEDLKPDRQPDPRTVAPFDEAMWEHLADANPCPADSKGFGCMSIQVGNRISGVSTLPADTGVRNLTRQYVALRDGLTQLLPNETQNRVMITEYPYFVFREILPTDSPDNIYQLNHDGGKAAGCEDIAFDGRAGMVPGIVAWIPGFGIKKGIAIKAADAFQTPLNNAIEAAAIPNDGDALNTWQVVRSHVVNGRTHGYCSTERYYNTVFDSYWYQGRKYGAGRDLANVEILKDGFEIPKGERFVWNSKSPAPCFEAWSYGDPVLRASGADCISETGAVKEHFYQSIGDRAKKGLFGLIFGAFVSNIGTTGPVHPNFFGHCNYAAAIVSQIVVSNPTAIPFDPRLEADVKDGKLLTADDICQSEVWGFVPKSADKAE